MYHLYQTEGFVVEHKNTAESKSIFLIWTRDFGMIRCGAQSVRLIHSKLRSHLQNYSFSSISLISGKSGWRAVNAYCQFNLFQYFRKESYKMEICANIFNLLKKLLSGEEKNQLLFDSVFKAFSFLKNTELSVDELKDAECLLALDILSQLGYIGQENLLKKLTFFDWNKELLKEITPMRRKVLFMINRSLKANHLL